MQRGPRLEIALGLALAAIACAVAPRPACADDGTEARNRVRFRVQSAREVPNDWVTAVVGVSEEDVDPAALASRVNRTMAWALDRAKAVQGVELHSGAYGTYPVYEDGKLRRWRASQELVLESADGRAMTSLVGTLQSRLQLHSFQFSVSDDTRASVEQELVAQALAAFRARADLVRTSLGAGGYAIDDISVETGGGRPPPRPLESRAMAAEVAPPAVEGGSSRVTVSVQGSIVLQ